MKKYINPNIPRPTPGDSKSEATRYKTQPVKPEPTPKPKPNVITNPGGGKKKKRVIVGGGKKIGPAKKKDLYPGDQYAPKPTKPTPNRRRFLDELNEMNKRSR